MDKKPALGCKMGGFGLVHIKQEPQDLTNINLEQGPANRDVKGSEIRCKLERVPPKTTQLKCAVKRDVSGTKMSTVKLTRQSQNPQGQQKQNVKTAPQEPMPLGRRVSNTEKNRMAIRISALKKETSKRPNPRRKSFPGHVEEPLGYVGRTHNRHSHQQGRQDHFNRYMCGQSAEEIEADESVLSDDPIERW